MTTIDWEAQLFPDLSNIYSKSRPNDVFWAETDDFYTYSVLYQTIQSCKRFLLDNCHSNRIGIVTDDPFSSCCLFWSGLLANKQVFMISEYLSDDRVAELCDDYHLHLLSSKTMAQTEYSALGDESDDYKSDESKGISMHDGLIHLFSSGSTGKPKCVVHSLYNLMINAENANKVLGIAENSRYLLNLPLFHVSGLAIFCRSLLSGASIVCSKDLNLVFSYNITHLSCVEKQLIELLKLSKFQSHHLKAVLVGGGPVSESLLPAIKECGLPVYLTYGMTETASQIAIGSYDALNPGFTGIIGDHASVLIEDGQCLIQSKSLCLGYLDAKDNTIQSAKENNYFHSKDRAELKENQIKILGRIDLMFVSCGENIYPEAIETILVQHPDVSAAVVVAKPDEQASFVPVAFISSQRNLSDIEDELKASVKEQLSSLHCPKAYIPLDQQSAMKADRYYLTTKL